MDSLNSRSAESVEVILERLDATVCDLDGFDALLAANERITGRHINPRTRIAFR